MTDLHLATLMDAIAEQEGYFSSIPSSRPRRNHNPGDLRNWPGFPTDAGGFAIFSDDAFGWTALKTDLRNHAAHYPDQTLLEFIAGDGKGWPGYAPANDGNDPSAYALALASALGVETTTRFADL